MKPIAFFSFLISAAVTLPTQAQMPYIEEVRALGSIAGQGMACGSSKYPTFEMLARAVILTKAPNNRMMNDGVYAYNEEKANSFLSKQMDGFYECPLIVKHFDNQEIFNITLYADGTLKMPDGKIITPKTPYDASQLYSQDSKEIETAQKIYDKAALKGSPSQIKATVTSTRPDSRPRYDKAVQPPAVITTGNGSAASVPQNTTAPLSANIKHISRRK